MLAGQLRDEFNVPRLKSGTVIPFRDKVIMKDVLQSKGIHTPRYCSFDNKQTVDPSAYFQNLQQIIGLPFILKPTSLPGGLGVVIIDSLSSFVEFCKENPVEAEYEAEEFITGTLFHCDSIRKA